MNGWGALITLLVMAGLDLAAIAVRVARARGKRVKRKARRLDARRRLLREQRLAALDEDDRRRGLVKKARIGY